MKPDLKRLSDLGNGPLLHGALRLEVENEGVGGVGGRRRGRAHHGHAWVSSPPSRGSSTAGAEEMQGDAAREERYRGDGGGGEQLARRRRRHYLTLISVWGFGLPLGRFVEEDGDFLAISFRIRFSFIKYPW